MSNCQQKLAEQLSRCTGGVGYEPFPEEVRYDTHPLLADLRANFIMLPRAKEVSPLEWAAIVQAKLATESHIALIVPGKRFDAQGTRHGRGFGWFDRFLYSVPRHWLRIGIATPEQFFDEPLPRQPWDEQVDWILIARGDAWEVIETGARPQLDF